MPYGDPRNSATNTRYFVTFKTERGELTWEGSPQLDPSGAIEAWVVRAPDPLVPLWMKEVHEKRGAKPLQGAYMIAHIVPDLVVSVRPIALPTEWGEAESPTTDERLVAIENILKRLVDRLEDGGAS